MKIIQIYIFKIIEYLFDCDYCDKSYYSARLLPIS